MKLAILAALVAAPAAAPALAWDSDSAIGNETTTVDAAQDKVQSPTTAEAKPPVEFKVPAGYRARKRGKNTVYCKKDMESGTRFAQEKCYDEVQLKEMEAAREEEQARVDQMRKVCAAGGECGGN
ncbi:MAG: hypothetical protein ACREVI_08225 [Steroidobacteraceae bacterium]